MQCNDIKSTQQILSKRSHYSLKNTLNSHSVFLEFSKRATLEQAIMTNTSAILHPSFLRLTVWWHICSSATDSRPAGNIGPYSRLPASY